MFILIFPTRLKFSLLSFLVFRNLTTFWVENKMAKYLRMRQIPSMYYTPVGRSFFAFDGQGRPLGEGWNWFLFKYSAFWVEGHAGKHWWWVAAVCKISYNFYVLTIALKKFEEWNVVYSVMFKSQKIHFQEYTVILKLSFPVFLIMNALTLYTLSSICVFSTLFF